MRKEEIAILKRIIALVLTVLMALGALAGCDKAPSVETSVATTAADEESKQYFKVLTLGHSLTVDCNHMLALVAAAEGYAGLEVGTLYASGCPMKTHVYNLQNDIKGYSLYYSTSDNVAATPKITNDVSMKDALIFRDWDLIVMQGGSFDLALEDTYTDGNIQIIQDYVNEYKLNKNADFAWHLGWAFATDPDLQAIYTKQTGLEKNFYTEGYKPYNNDRMVLYNKFCANAEKYIVPNETFQFIIPTGTMLENAMSSYMTEKDLLRDYAHGTDFSRLMGAYIWYCRIANVEQLEDIKLTTVPRNFIKTYAGAGDMTLTEAEKAILIESVNNALKQPLQQTQSQYTEAPAK